MLTAVIIGAFGSHALREVLLENNRQNVFATASSYHFYHALAILVLGTADRYLFTLKNHIFAVSLICVGVVLFSGSLYILALGDISWLGVVTPIGGTVMVLGWGLLSVDLLRSLRD